MVHANVQLGNIGQENIVLHALYRNISILLKKHVYFVQIMIHMIQYRKNVFLVQLQLLFSTVLNALFVIMVSFTTQLQRFVNHVLQLWHIIHLQSYVNVLMEHSLMEKYVCLVQYLNTGTLAHFSV